MDIYEERKQAISLYESGEKITWIVKSFNKSRQWFYFWLHRYRSANGKGLWYKGESKAPKTRPNKVPVETEQQVILAREQLEKQRHSQTGSVAIQYKMRSMGLDPPPPWTINRILARHGLSQKSLKGYQKSNKEYPRLFDHTHQLDFIGPRYIKGDGKYYMASIIDTECRNCYLYPARRKSSFEAFNTLVSFWTAHGMPDALQMDNDLAFRGSNQFPRSFGPVVRLALSLNIAPVFIPMAEPWRNGIIEKFNHTVEKRLIRATVFESFSQLCQQSVDFLSFHNQNHRYSALSQRTPNQMRESLGSLLKLDKSVDFKQRIPLLSGVVYFIRFIRGDSMLNLHSEKFKLHKDLRYSYVVAEVNIDNHCLSIRQESEIVQNFSYKIPVDW